MQTNFSFIIIIIIKEKLVCVDEVNYIERYSRIYVISKLETTATEKIHAFILEVLRIFFGELANIGKYFF